MVSTSARWIASRACGGNPPSCPCAAKFALAARLLPVHREPARRTQRSRLRLEAGEEPRERDDDQLMDCLGAVPQRAGVQRVQVRVIESHGYPLATHAKAEARQ